MKIENKITVYPFSQEKLIELICPYAVANDEPIPEQAAYLARYCETLDVKTLVHENHYVDRHYVDEYASYYSRMLSPPKNYVQRLHFFGHEFNEAQFSQWLERSFSSVEEKKIVETELLHGAGTHTNKENKYFGYCAIRPISSAPIGRTIIARLPDSPGKPTREIWATSSHRVHLGSLVLHVDGLAFQQQDAAVGACATAALWSALVRVARHDGIRAPTPAEITEVATHVTKHGARPILAANAGLTIYQLCQATRSLGFNPEVFSARAKPEFFMIAMHTYLLSGIPVVLALRRDGIGHAVAAAGFQITPTDLPNLQTTFKVRSARIKKLYIHDDRMGPYARSYIEPFPYQPDIGDGLLLEIDWHGQSKEDWIVDSGIAPVYPKLRLPIQSLIALAEYIGAPVEKMVGSRATELNMEALSPEERRAQRYVDEDDIPAPSVITLNALAAAHGVNDYLFRMTGLRKQGQFDDYLYIEPRTRSMRLDESRLDKDCLECSSSSLGRYARGDSLRLPTSPD